MNIGLVSEGYYPVYDGVSNYVANLSQGFREKGHRVYIFAPFYPQHDHDTETNVVRIPSAYPWLMPPYRVAKPWAAKRIFHQIFQQLNLDVIHSQIPSITLYPAYQTCRELGIPHIATYHTYLERYLPHYISFTPKFMARRLARSYSRSTCRRSDCVVVPSRAMKQLLTSYGIKTRIECIPCSIDIETFQGASGLSIRQEFGLAEDERVLVYAGRLTSEKNIGFILEVLRRLLRDKATGHLKLLIAGTGRHEGNIKKDCLRLGLGEAVLFAGLIEDRHRLADFYAAGDVFVLASLTETFGTVLVEAQASGTPVVAVGDAGTRDAVKDGYGGYLTQPDIEQFTGIVRRLLLDAELRKEQSQMAKEQAKRFSLNTITTRLLEVYDSLLKATG